MGNCKNEGSYPTNILTAQRRLIVKYPDCVSLEPLFKVCSWEVQLIGNGDPIIIIGSGNELADIAINPMSSATYNTKIIIIAKVKRPDGLITNCVASFVVI